MEKTDATDRGRLRELVLYVARRCENTNLFGTIKLNKILFLADVRAFRETGTTITGSEYVKDIFGPVPKEIESLIESMESRREAVLVEREMPDGNPQKRLIAIRAPKAEMFSGPEISTIEQVIEWVRPMSAFEVSELTHRMPAWNAARMGEIIPIRAAAYLPSEPIELTAAEWDHVNDFISKHGDPVRTSAPPSAE